MAPARALRPSAMNLRPRSGEMLGRSDVKKEVRVDSLDKHPSPDGPSQRHPESRDDVEMELRDVLSAIRRDYDPVYDKRDMRRLGKVQELKRRFRFFTIGGYIVVLGITWEFALTTSVFGLNNGGTAGAIWLNLIVCFGMFITTVTMAEMASMAPTAGGQYHWVSEFAPPQYQKQLSYVVGWLCALGWQTGLPSISYIGAQQVIALISVCMGDAYTYHGWHGALMTMAFVLFAISFNTILIGKLPFMEGVAVVLHVCGFFAVIVIFWVMGPRDDAAVVFTHFSDDNGWGSVGLATLLGIVGPVATYLGPDSAVHLGEELKDASYVLPRAMVSAAIMNYILGFVTTVSFVSNLGDVQELLDSPTGQPWVGLIQRITRSKAATIILLVLMIILYLFSAVNAVTTTSRQIWSFARDKGLPFHQFLSQVRPHTGVPMNAVVVTMVITCLVALIIIGSSLAFNIILSVSAAGVLSSYIVVIACLLRKKLLKEPLLRSKWNLGVLGIPLNFAALIFCSVALFFLFWPPAPHPTPASMNWNSLIYGVAVLFSVGYYWFRGRFEYDGPVEYVRKDEY